MDMSENPGQRRPKTYKLWWWFFWRFTLSVMVAGFVLGVVAAILSAVIGLPQDQLQVLLTRYQMLWGIVIQAPISYVLIRLLLERVETNQDD